jgi:hypothetical protein
MKTMNKVWLEAWIENIKNEPEIALCGENKLSIKKF